ncbi:ABC transporter substrate-binding protein [Devosia sp. A449]
MQRRSFLTGLAVLSGALLSSTALSMAQTDASTFSGTLVVSAALEPNSFNVNYDTFGGAGYINLNIYSKLVGFDTILNEVFPDLAESWEISEDLTVYTFRLRSGVKWHDGTPFTSADVKWTLDDIIAQGDSAVTFKFLSDITSVETPDDLTVIANLSRPNGIMVQNFASYNGFNILPKHLYEGTDARTNPANLVPIGTGPFRFVEHVAGSHVMLEPNTGYYRDGPYLERLVFQFIPNLATSLLALEAGQIGYVTASPPFADVARLQSLPGVKVDATSSAIVMWFGFNFDKPMWQDPRMRKAVSHAINRDDFVKKLYLDLVKPAWTHFTSAVPWAYDETARQPEFDLAEAERLLDEAGYPRGADGTRFSVNFIVFPTNIWGSPEQANMVKQQLSAVGIDVQVEVVEFALRNEAISKREFDFVHGGGLRGPDPSELVNYYDSRSPKNSMKYANPRVDELLVAGRSVADLDKRREYYSELQHILAHDQPMVTLIEYGYMRTYREGYDGFFWNEQAAGKVSEHMYSMVKFSQP